MGAKLMEQEDCEEFFLLDGRSPVELPSTWEEARESFVDICEKELARERPWCHAKGREVFRDAPAVGPTLAAGQLGTSLCADLRSFVETDDHVALLEGRKPTKENEDDMAWWQRVWTVSPFAFIGCGLVCWCC